MLGRLLCKLGVHDTHITGRMFLPETGYHSSTWGNCVRRWNRTHWLFGDKVEESCTYAWQWDN